MADFSREEIKTLASQQTGPFVSLYMPIRRETVPPKQDKIRLKHLIQTAREQLLALQTDKDTAEAILAPAVDLLDNPPFWQQPREGLALFLAPDLFRSYDDDSIAVAFDEAVHVGSQFSFKPLLPALTGDGPFYILALKQEHFGLLRATRDTVRPLKLEGSPTNIDEALGEEIPGKERRVHPLNMADGTQEGISGAHDSSKQEKDRILRYCRVVNKEIHKYLAGKSAPLVIAALEYLHP